MQSSATGAVGDLSSLQGGQVLLPSFVVQRADGIYVDISALDSPDLLPRFVEHVFSSDACFRDIDYALFLKLLFEYTPHDIDHLLQRFEAEGRKSEMRIASAIVDFPRARQELYRGLKVADDGESADYLFEQISREVEYEEMTYGEPDEAGVRHEAGFVTKIRCERAFLNFDEFVAAAWLKGLRYGIDVQQVRACIAADKNERITIARQKLPEPGHDASVEESTDSLHRDDRPGLLPNGRLDLARYSNRFPQVTAGTRLFRKLPRALGASGWSVQGKELPPDPVKDFDIEKLAGTGTRIERLDNGDLCIVAAIDGFVSIDPQSSEISISEKIINRTGVSARTTGNLVLSGDEFEEHGEVQESRAVTGHHMTFFADVFGNITSDGGRILFKKSISGGTATNAGGTIQVEGKASSAVLAARNGTIEGGTAEGSLLLARVVRVKSAVRCDILAEEVVIESAEACCIAARKVTLGRASMRKNRGTQILMLLPDITQHDQEIKRVIAELAEAQAELATRNDVMAALAAQPDLKSYLSLQSRIKAGTLVMSPAQEANWKLLQGRVAPALREYAGHQTAIQSLQRVVAEATPQIEKLKRDRAAALAAVKCTIGEVAGETLVRGRRVRIEGLPFEALPPKELRVKLQEALPTDERIFADDTGSLDWLQGAGDAP